MSQITKRYPPTRLYFVPPFT